jgi:hypothetical protein
MTLWRWLMDQLERLGDLASDAFADLDDQEEA